MPSHCRLVYVGGYVECGGRELGLLDWWECRMEWTVGVGIIGAVIIEC